MSIILVSVIAYVYPSTFAFSSDDELYKWLDIVTWGGFLFIVGYCMGLLFEKKEETKKEIKTTYRGIIEMLSLCPYCGSSVILNCPSCGKERSPGWNYCPYCNTEFTYSSLFTGSE